MNDDSYPDGENTGNQKDGSSGADPDQDPSDADSPALVIYMVEPFSYGEEWEDANRLAMLGLLRCYQEILKLMPPHLQNSTQLQVMGEHSDRIHPVIQERKGVIKSSQLVGCDTHIYNCNLRN